MSEQAPSVRRATVIPSRRLAGQALELAPGALALGLAMSPNGSYGALIPNLIYER
jgi:hypothetical protein